MAVGRGCLKSGHILLFGTITSEKISYRKLSYFVDHTIIEARDRQISQSSVTSPGPEVSDGTQAKDTGPTARNNPDAFKQVLTRMSLGGWRALRMLAVEQDTTLNALAIEALTTCSEIRQKGFGGEPSGRLSARSRAV